MSDPEAEAGGDVVIDASVALRWVLPERDAEPALQLRDRIRASGTPAHVPDLFWTETANVLWRLTLSPERRLDPGEARELLEALRTAPLSTVPVGPLAGRALEIACESGATVYDATYVAVAEVRGASLWTADERLVRTMTGTEWEALLAPLEPHGD